MGPTASGKTDVAIRLCERFPLDVVSVDSALVYRGMDIGTAKPDAEVLRRTPHRLIDIRDPEQSYSAGEFVRDARIEIERISGSGRVPLLVGGTMMYFRALTAGMADLPAADAGIRADIDADAGRLGWPALHERLGAVDPDSAARINRNDSQRIQRALEVYLASGKPLSHWQAATVQAVPAHAPRFVKLGLWPKPRKNLHERIEMRLKSMIDKGFLDEVRMLAARPGLSREHPSMRAVGYRQLWAHVAGEGTLEEAITRSLAATRQLAKRQLTWMKSETELECFEPLETAAVDAISSRVAEAIVD
jgi:tRNA dimethylallyltransferase